ncbi:MAG TPA: glycosyltransferase family 39 protein [Bradyrhizobium sp.]|nr:glycosyltransferase family 39 protein [Bradyrhizobium sp.]
MLKHYPSLRFVQSNETIPTLCFRRYVGLPVACFRDFLAAAVRSIRELDSSLSRPQRFNSFRMLLWVCVAVVAALTLLRCMFIVTIDLRVDEAYYWTWSKENVISYLDHPPLIAWLIRLSTSVFGDTNFGVRFPALLSMALMQVLLASIVWRIVRDLRYVVAVMLMPEASLAYGLGMAKITPDIALIPCELVALHSDFDRLGPAVRLAPAGVSDQ